MSQALWDEVFVLLAEILPSCLWWKVMIRIFFYNTFRKEKAQCLAFLMNRSPASPAKKAGSKCKPKVATIWQKLDSYLVLKGLHLQFGAPNTKAWKSIIPSITTPDMTSRYTVLLAGKVGSASLVHAGVKQCEAYLASVKQYFPLGGGGMNSLCGVWSRFLLKHRPRGEVTSSLTIEDESSFCKRFLKYMYTRVGQGELLQLPRTWTSICNGAGEVVQQFQRKQIQRINKGKFMKLQTYITA